MGNNTSSNKDVQDYDDFDEDLTILIPTLELLIAQFDHSDDILVNLLADLQYKQKLEERKKNGLLKQEKKNGRHSLKLYQN